MRANRVIRTLTWRRVGCAALALLALAVSIGPVFIVTWYGYRALARRTPAPVAYS